MIVHLVRHGQTVWNRDRLFQGQSDVELTDLGKTQSRLVAEEVLGFGPESVYTSTFSRTRYIADFIGEGIDKYIIEVPGLLELNLGLLEGKTGEDLRKNWPEIIENWREHPSKVEMPSGESFLQLHQRASHALNSLVESETKDVIVLVSHNFVIKVLLCGILGLSVDALHKIHVDLASISTIQIDNTDSSLVSLNSTSHLN